MRLRLSKVAVLARALSASVGTCSSMGDKSPKATNKKASQKQANTKANTQKKSNATASKQAASGKK